MNIIQNKIVISLTMLTLVLLTVRCGDDPVTLKPPSKPDTTSHKIVWEIDTLGAWRSDLYDVWGSSPDNIWATGWIRNETWGTNIIHYDGVEWEEYDYYEAYLRGIFGLSENDIWAVGNNLSIPARDALIAHYDGVEWKTVYTKIGMPSLRNVWASASNDVFAVGSEGLILHYDGNSWSQMESGTKYHLRDVWGFAGDDVYACGGNIGDTVRPILFHYDGISWESVLDTTKEDRDYLESIWGTSSNNLYFSSVSGFYQGSVNSGWTPSVIPDDHTAINKLRGSSEYNIFIAGHFGLLLHYNGNTWYRYDEIFSKSYPYGPILSGIMAFENFVFVVGLDVNNAKAIIYRGTIKN